MKSMKNEAYKETSQVPKSESWRKVGRRSDGSAAPVKGAADEKYIDREVGGTGQRMRLLRRRE